MANILWKGRRKSVLERDTSKLQDWLKKQPHLPDEIDNELLVAFISGTKSLDVAKNKLDNYLYQRGRAPHLFHFSVRDPSRLEFQEAASSVKLMILPKPTPEGYRVFFGAVDKDFSYYNQRYFEVRVMMICELAMIMFPEMNGLIVIFDLNGIDSSLMDKLTPMSTVALRWYQNSVPVRLEKGVFFNASDFMDTAMSFVRPLMKEEVSKNLIVTPRDVEVVKEHVELDMLPSDYGGTESTSDELNEYWLELLEQKREWFRRTSLQHSNELRRPSETSDPYGIDGIFRPLSLD